MKNLVYFSAADRQLESFLDDEAFERSLMLNILFQEGLLIPDIFCFESKYLESHLSTRGSGSLFETGIKHGLVVPTFRGQGTSSFTEDLEIIEAAGGGTSPVRGVLDNARSIAERLQAAADRNKSFEPATLPQFDLARNYDKLITDKLSNDDPPNVDQSSGITQQDVDMVWYETRPWRTVSMDEARAGTDQVGVGGLLRGQILIAVSGDIGLTSPERVGDVREVLKFVEQNDPAKYPAVKTFFRWMIDLYQLNHARAFGAIPNIPEYGPLNGILMADIVRNEPNANDLAPNPIIHLKAKLPAIKTLYQMNPENLVAIRKDVGPDYFKSMRAWQLDRSNENAQKVANKLTDYCGAISKQCKGNIGYADADIELFLASVDSRTRDVLKAASEFVNTVPLVKQFADSLVTLTKFGYACYRWIIHRPKEYDISIRSTELDLPLEEDSTDDSGESRDEDPTADSE